MYTHYAEYYDAGQMRFSILMFAYLQELLRSHPIVEDERSSAETPQPRRMIDLACGTGTLALMMAEEGWDVLGIDRSADMLRMAQRKTRRFRGPGSVRFRRADMRDFAVDAPAGLVTCFYDSLNYIQEEDELLNIFANVKRSLTPGGLWIFDMNTPYFLEHIWSEVEVEEREGYLQVMQSHFDANRCTSTLVLTGFSRTNDDRYSRFDEVHVERGYPVETINDLLVQAGFVVEATYDCFTSSPPHPESHRIAWVARHGTPRG